MSNYSEKSMGRRSSPPFKYRQKSPYSRSKHSRSRSPHHDHQASKRPSTFRSTFNSSTGSCRYKSPSPPPRTHFFIRPVYPKSREEELIRYNPPENNVLAVFGLSKQVIEQDLFDLYQSFGVKECKVIIDKHSGCPKGFGFVYFSRTKDAIIARDKTNGILMFGKPIRVDFSIGERDYSALPAVGIAVPLQRPVGAFSSCSSRDFHNYRELREGRLSSQLVEAVAHSRDLRMPREVYKIERGRLVRATSPSYHDRYSSPHRHESNNYHDRRRVVTPPLPVQLERNNNRSYKRSRSRSFERSSKKHK